MSSAQAQAVPIEAAPARVPPTALPPSLAAVYEAYFDYVWHALRRLGVHERDLEDVAHDVFLAVHRRYADFDATRPVRPWLFGISMRVASDYRRSARVRREVLRADFPEVHAAGRGPQEQVSAAEARRLVLEALEDVEMKYRVVFVMHELHEHSMPEIASVVDAPLNTLYSRLRLARRQFAAAFERLRMRGAA